MKNNIIRFLALFGMLSALAGCGSAQAYLDEQMERNVPADAGTAEQLPVQADATEAVVFVHICGAVIHPGVYSLPPGSRLIDAVEAAGGFAADASEESLNLAAGAEDGQMYRVLTKEEAAQAGSAGGAAADTSSPYTADGKLDINMAGLAELCSLSGIGESKAKAILAYRDENGAFTSPEDIKNVSGIGEGIYNRIKDEITVR
ncbi:MAG: ComEA family DNA-binding protein [Lachnospiraceae bacterium]|nr:ComEA family DNA-binding protein [Lachnospiraceae bacterium]